jgi:DNA-binding LacI/PurR family transcriptional regulator
VDAPINIKDVAAHGGVSVGIVSNVPNRPEIVAQATPERVRTAVKALGFVRNESAGQLRAGRTSGSMAHRAGPAAHRPNRAVSLYAGLRVR